MLKKITLHWIPEAPQFSDSLQRLADEVWETRPAHIFNGNLLVYAGQRRETGVLHLTGAFTEYRYYYAQRITKHDFGLIPIGVSGITICEDQVIFAQRSAHTTTYSGWIELVPSGGIDRPATDNHRVDYESMLRREFEEETGLSTTVIESLRPLNVFYDPNEPIYDIACEIKVNATLATVLETMQNSEEYDTPIAVPLSNLRDWLNKHYGGLIPMSFHFAEWYLHVMNIK